jgi:hypothetical protein
MGSQMHGGPSLHGLLCCAHPSPPRNPHPTLASPSPTCPCLQSPYDDYGMGGMGDMGGMGGMGGMGDMGGDHEELR